MRASELIGSAATYEDGRSAGIVRDLRLSAERGADGSFEILGLVLSDPGVRSAAAHAWGFAQGRAQAPGLLRRALGGAGGRSRVVDAGSVIDWRPGRLQVRKENR